MTRRIVLVFALAALLVPAATYAQDYKVVVHSGNPTDILTKEQLGKMFLKKIAKWDTGIPIIPVDQTPNSAVRVTFNKVVHAKPASAIASYWQQQIFAGRDVPPAEKEGDGAVLAFVKATPGAIGYVSADAATDGVKILSIR